MVCVYCNALSKCQGAYKYFEAFRWCLIGKGRLIPCFDSTCNAQVSNVVIFVHITIISTVYPANNTETRAKASILYIYMGSSC